MKKIQTILLAAALLVLSGCNLLERPALTKMSDDNFWRNEEDVRAYANGFYDIFFPGYGLEWDRDWTPVYATFADDFVSEGTQDRFTSTVPSSLGSSSASRSCNDQFYGPTWGFGLIRKINIFIDRLNSHKDNLTEEQFNHWMAVAKFYKAYQYADLVTVYGDVPYFETTVRDDDPDTMYKDRDSRAVVMDAVYDMFKYAVDNMRADDGALNINKYVAATIASRFMLFEGTWQKYHDASRGGGDAQRANKFLTFAAEAAKLVLDSDKYSFTSDFKSLFASMDLSGNPEVIFYRHYDASLAVTHCVGSYHGGSESGAGTNLACIKAFLCNDGKPYQTSEVEGANDFSLENLVKTRDPRFDGTFYDKPIMTSSSLLYCNKFASREALEYYEETHNVIKPTWYSDFNENDCPVVRLAEAALNYIEAKAELGTATQKDVDITINAIRNRPLDAGAIKRGVKKTAALSLTSIPDDPARDADVSPLLWEIRRERRMEFYKEGTRIKDLLRWHKLDYMNYDKDKDHYLGPWVDFSATLILPNPTQSEYLKDKKNVLKVQDATGKVITYDGTNLDEMKGFYVVRNAKNRDAFGDRNYLAPIGQAQIDDYKTKGYTLTQTFGW